MPREGGDLRHLPGGVGFSKRRGGKMWEGNGSNDVKTYKGSSSGWQGSLIFVVFGKASLGRC